MRFRSLNILLLCLISGLTPVLPARSATTYTPLPPDLDGSMMPLDFSQCTPAAQLPDSLQPVYASYVSRHGARYLSGPKKTDALYDALQKGVNTGTLSSTGEAFFVFLKEIIDTNRGHWGDLSPIGIDEQLKMGSRVYDAFTPLSLPETQVSAISSFVPRSVMTMYQFSNKLIRLNDSITVKTDEGHQFSPLVCCFIADENYARYRKQGDWKPVYDEFVSRHISIEPARRLFTSTNLSDRELRKLTIDMYEVLKGNRAAGLPAPTTRWMSTGEYTACWRADNLSHYLRNTITSLSSDAAHATAPLLLDIISHIDNAVASANPKPAFNGYFGHAETLMPLFSLLRLPGCYILTRDYNELEKFWKIQEVTPLGANLLILISRGPSGRRYVSMQLNGRTIRPMAGRPDIVAWSELRAYWTDILNGYNIEMPHAPQPETTELTRPYLE